MIQKVSVTNYRNETLELKLSDPWETGLAIGGIDGIGAPDSDIRMTEYATLDGALATGARAGTREITITFLPIWSRNGESVEVARRKLYRYFPIKQLATIAFYTENGARKIQGYVSAIAPDIFQQQESVVVTLKCPDPWLKDTKEQFADTNNEAEAAFEFPVELSNVGSGDYDAIASLKYVAYLSDPVSSSSSELYWYAGEWYTTSLPRMEEYGVDARSISWQFSPPGVVPGTRFRVFGNNPEISKIAFYARYKNPQYLYPRFGQTLRGKSVGDSVYVNYLGETIECIIIQKGSPSDLYADADGVWLMTKNTVDTYATSSFGDGINNYPTSNLRDVESTLELLFGAFERSQMKTIKVPYFDRSTMTLKSGSDGASVKAFSLSLAEMGADPVPFNDFSTSTDIPKIGTRLQYFQDTEEITVIVGADSYTTQWNTEKTLSNSGYWTREIGKYAGFDCMKLVLRRLRVGGGFEGIPNPQIREQQTSGIRLAFVLPYDTMVDDHGIVTQNYGLEYEGTEVRCSVRDSTSGFETVVAVAEAENGIHDGALSIQSCAANDITANPLKEDTGGNPISLTFSQTMSFHLKDPSATGTIFNNTRLNLNTALLTMAIPFLSASDFSGKTIIDLSAMTGYLYDGAGNVTGTGTIAYGAEIRSAAFTVKATFSATEHSDGRWYIDSETPESIELTDLSLNDYAFPEIVYVARGSRLPILFYGVSVVGTPSLPPASGVMSLGDVDTAWPLDGTRIAMNVLDTRTLAINPVAVIPLTEFSIVGSGADILINYSGDAEGYPIFSIQNTGDSAITSTLSLAVNSTIMEIDCSRISGGFPAGSVIEITTAPGNKKVVLDKETNIINALDRNSKWPSLRPGSNVIAVESTDDTDLIRLWVRYHDQYQGV